jgi:hypothetical protein
MKNTASFIVIVLLAAVASFFGGMKYRDFQLAKNRDNFANGSFRGVPPGSNGQFRNSGVNNTRFGNGRPIEGEITSSDDKSITVKMPDGATRIVILSDSTTYSKSDTSSKNDLKTGAVVAVFGTSNSDGSLTAQNIQLNPQFRLSVTPTPQK